MTPLSHSHGVTITARRIVCVVTLFVALAPNVFAQGGSNYSGLGIGDLRRGVGALYDAMAGTSIAVPTTHGINTINPALLGMEATTRIQVGYRFNQYLINAGDEKLHQNNGKLDGMLGLFSVDTAVGFGMSLGLLPYSTVNYSVRRDLTTQIEDETIIGRSNQLGEGGSSMMQFGASVRLFNRLHLGASVSALFGLITHNDQIIANGNFATINSFQSYDIRGTLFRGGLYLPITPAFSIGAIFSGGPTASVVQTQSASGIVSGRAVIDTLQFQAYETGLPVTYGFGATTFIGKSILSAEVEWQDFSGVTVNNRPNATLATSFRTSIGYSQPGSRSLFAPYFERWGFHAGAAYQKLYVVYDGQPIDEAFGAFGLDFPLGGNAVVDAALNLGWRAPRGAEGLTEMVARLTVTVSIGEHWFKPFARE